ncbi:MAG: DUF4037 domain-containing protein [Candidatus Borkfalkiaceae bacterium]|nr:DUF4037 domain-containing protein [Christensenellaceae bacterium]
MKGLEISRNFWEEYGRPMIENEFSEYSGRIAAGLVGHGSECFGFDDELSTDHDFDAGFCIWLTEEDEKLFGFKLFRAYSKLPQEYMGCKIKNKSIFGNSHKGVHTIPEFYSFYTGCGGAPTSAEHWLSIPSHYLAEATNGEVFWDPLGEFTSIRNEILHGMPRDVWLKKAASAALTMAQTGQYNFSRILSRGDTASAAITLSRFAEATLEMIFLLNHAHAPYYKWLFKAAENLPEMRGSVADVERLITDKDITQRQSEDLIEKICTSVIDELVLRGLCTKQGDYLEGYAYMLNNSIKDGNIRNSGI